jgi:hypothetical protein
MSQQNLSYVLKQGQKIPERYHPLEMRLSPVGTPEEVRKVLRAMKLQATLNGQEVIFRKSGLDYEIFYRDLKIE